MSSFTSKTVRDLYEAYNSVYIDETELFLNDLLDTVTESVNELVNEGYDLSDYSWDEIYESFLENVLEPELQEVESFITQLNESAEELTEEQIENLLENPLLRGLSFFSRGPKVTGSGGVTIPRPQPTPGTGRPLRNPRQLELPVGQDKGSFARFGDWLSSLTSKGRAQQAAKPPTPPTPPKSPAGTPKPQQGQQGWPSIGLRGKLKGGYEKIRDVTSKVTQALTPGPKTKAALKYGALPTFTSLATPALGVDVYNLATGRPSDLQKLSGYAQGTYGNLLQTGARIGGKLGSSTAPGMFELGRQMKQAGAETQAKVETKKKSSQGTGRTGITGQIDQTTGKPVYNSYEMEGEENINEVLAYDKKTDKWYNIDGKGNKTEVTPSQTAIDRYNRLLQQKQGQGRPQSQPPATPRPPVASPKPGERKPGETTTEFHKRLRGQLPPAAPVAPPATPPVASRNDGGGTRRALAPTRQPAPQASPVAAYMRAAAAARKSGDPAQMAAVRDQGLAIWRDKYKDTLAKKVSPTGQQLGTGQSVMAKQAAELRDLRPVKTPEAPVNTSVTTTATPAPKPTVKTDTAAQRAQEAQKPIPPTVNPVDTTKLEKSKVRGISTGIVASSYEYDAYDLVLEYILSEGHADTIEEANYVMMQLDSDYIGSIVEGTRPTPVEHPLDKASFKKRRRSLAGREASADAKSRGHVDKFTGKPYGTAEAASRRKNLNPAEREARRKFAEDPD